MERRTPIVELTARELSCALRSLIPNATLASFELAKSGRANTNYFLHTDQGRFVLRLHVRDSRLGAKEKALAELVAGKVSTAPILGQGCTGEGQAFSLLGFVDGSTLEQVLLAANSPRVERAARDLGRALAKLVGQHLSPVGDLVSDARGALVVEPWSFSDFFQWALFDSPAGARLGRLRERLWAFLQAAQDRYPNSWPIHLVHGDFNPTNLLIDDAGNLTAVLDWEFAHAGQIWADLGNLLRHRPAHPLPDSFTPALLEGLSDAGVTLPDHWRSLSLIADLSSACEFLSSPDDRPQTHALALAQIHSTLALLDVQG